MSSSKSYPLHAEVGQNKSIVQSPNELPIRCAKMCMFAYVVNTLVAPAGGPVVYLH